MLADKLQECLLIEAVVEVFAHVGIRLLPGPSLRIHVLLVKVMSTMQLAKEHALILVLTVLSVAPMEAVLPTPILVLVHAESITPCRLTEHLPNIEHQLGLPIIHLLNIIVVQVRVY